MEAVATFFLLLIIYFLGYLAIVQLVIHPKSRLGVDSNGNKKVLETNHAKILLVSIFLALVTTTVAYLIFP